MQARCDFCEFEGFVEPVNMTCPACHGDLSPVKVIDFDEYGVILRDIYNQDLKASIVKHGDWSSYSPGEVFEKVAGEFDEYREAYVAQDTHGAHGQVQELKHLVVTACKGIRRLQQREAVEVVDAG